MKFLWSFFFSILLFGGSPVRAGNEVGNGADDPSGSEVHAWFVQLSTETQVRKIRYCYHLEPSFGVASDQIEQSLKGAFQIWTKYLKDKSINETSPVRFVTESELMSSCDGFEDLRFELGTSNPEIEEQKKKFFRPTAFAVRVAPDEDQGWNSGWIWLAANHSLNPQAPFPNWTQEGNLTAILLHELGHVFGCGHIAGTIMDENLAKELGEGLLTLKQKSQIDQVRELVPAQRGFQFYKGTLGSPKAESGNFHLFEELAGRKPMGALDAQVVLERGTGSLLVKDDAGEYRWPLKLSGFRVYPNGENDQVFRYVLKRESLYRGNLHSEAYIQTGSLPVEMGRTLDIVLEFNLENPHSQGPLSEAIGPVNLKFNREGRGVPLFTSDPL